MPPNYLKNVVKALPWVFLVLFENYIYWHSSESPYIPGHKHLNTIVFLSVKFSLQCTLVNGDSDKVQVGKDQEKAQSEKGSHSKNRGGKKTN